MPLLPFFIIVAIEVLINWFFYKAENWFAIIICTAVNCFTIAVIVLIVNIWNVDAFLLIVPTILLQALGYKLFLISSWKKALLASLISFAAALIVSFFLANIIRVL